MEGNYKLARLSNSKIISMFQQSDKATSPYHKGKILEDLFCYIFEKIPGVSISMRNRFNAFQDEEIDIAFWNRQSPRGLYFLSFIILVECKNWSNPVSSSEVEWFAHKLESRSLEFGILIAANGISGSSTQINRSHNIVAHHLSRNRRLITIKRDELETLVSTEQLITMIQEKLCELAVAGVPF